MMSTLLPLKCLLLWALWSFTNGKFIQSQYEYEFYNKTILCINGEACFIQCLHDQSCKYANLNCPSDSNCNVTIQDDASQYININAQNSYDVIVRSNAEYALQYSNIYTPTNILNINCNYKYACASSIIHATNTNTINIHCLAQNACRNMKIFSDDTQSLFIHCYSSYSCQYLTLYSYKKTATPSELNVECYGSYSCDGTLIKSDADAVVVDCINSNACRNMDMYCEPKVDNNNCTLICSQSSCITTEIYVPEGIFDANIITTDTNADVKLYCGINYYQSCSLQRDVLTNQMLCDNHNFCMNYKHDKTDDENIVLLSDYQKYNESINCGGYKNCNIYCFGLNSCKYSTIDCNSSTNCNVFCLGQESCMRSNIYCPENVSNGTCAITCNSNSCKYAAIDAYNISSVIIDVEGSYGLQYAMITSSNINTITINCYKSYSCEQIDLRAVDTSNININCHATGSCRLSDLFSISSGNYYIGYAVHSNFNVDCYGSSSCHTNTIQSDAGYLNVDCNSDAVGNNACNTLSLYCPESSVLVSKHDTTIYCDVLCGGTQSCIGLDVHSINGWNNTRIWSIDDQFPTSAEMYCNPASTESCSMQGNVNSNEWYCDQLEICSQYRMDLNATYFITTRNYQFYNKTIQCEQDKDCYLYCTKPFSCQYVTFICANRDCTIYCTYGSSCIYAEIMADHANSIYVKATANYALQYAMIRSVSSLLDLQCIGSNACRYQIMYVTDTDKLSMNCMNGYSCSDQIIYAENTKNIRQNCIGSSSCYRSVLYQYATPQNIEDEIYQDCYGSGSCNAMTVYSSLPLEISCNYDDANQDGCWNANYFISNDQNFSIFCGSERSCGYIDIYSINGFINKNIRIFSNWDTYAQHATFHCGYSYDKSCGLIGLINSDLWICPDTNLCHDYQLNASQTDYHAIDQDYQHAYKYIHCDQSKKNCEIKCNSMHACWNSKIICPMNTDNETCSIFCKQANSCNNLQVYAINGYSQLDFRCNGDNTFCSGVTVYCTELFNNTCIMDNNMNCNGFCGDYNYNNTISLQNIDLSFASNSYYYGDSNILASYQNQYYNNTITCVGNNGVCKIECNNLYSCRYATVEFIGTHLQCNISCTGDRSCQFMEIHGDNCAVMNIEATYSYSLSYATIYPVNAVNINIVCSAMYSCRYMNLYTSTNDTNSSLQVYLSCKQKYACQSQYFDTELAQSITFDCLTQYACADSQYYVYNSIRTLLQCTNGLSCYNLIFFINTGAVNINCIYGRSCSNSRFIIPSNSTIIGEQTNSFQYNWIWAIHGSKSINITAPAQIANSVTTNKVYCTPSYYQACDIQTFSNNTEWNCDSEDPCFEWNANEYQYLTEYTYHHYMNEIMCDDNTDCYIYCTKLYGCQYSVIHCPKNYQCNIFCGKYGCQYATINTAANGILSLVCYNQYACDNLIIRDQYSAGIEIECNYDTSCQYMQLFVEYLVKLSLLCSASQSCRYSKIYNHFIDVQISTFKLECNHWLACSDMVVSTNAYNATIVCNKWMINTRGCNAMTVYYDRKHENGLTLSCINQNSCYNTNIYAIFGEYAIDITSFDDTNVMTNTLHCCNSYIHSCVLNRINSSEIVCNDNNAICTNALTECPSTNNITKSLFIDKQYEKYNETVKCTKNLDCFIVCNQQYSCSYSTIICPENFHCNVLCLSDNSCTYITILAVNSKSLSIVSTGVSSLVYANIYAPSDQNAFDMTCSNDFSCRYSEVYAHNTYVKSVSCSGYYSCNGINLLVENASLVRWNCMNTRSCSSGSVIQHSKYSQFEMKCAGSYACSSIHAMISAANVAIICTNSNNECSSMELIFGGDTANIMCNSQTSCMSMNIYVQKDPNRLNITRGSSLYGSSIKLHCGLAYEKSCMLQSNINSTMLRCDECFDYVLDFENTDYILFPGDYGNYKRDISCDSNKLNCEIYCIGIQSCRYNNIKCGINKNSLCKLYGKHYALANSNITAQSIRELNLISASDFTFSYANVIAHVDVLVYAGMSGNYPLQYSKIHLHASTADIMCTGFRSCRYMQLLIESDMHKINLECLTTEACQVVKLDSSQYNVNASITCVGQESCEYMDIFMSDMNELSINCASGYLRACQYMQIFADNMINVACAGSYACRNMELQVHKDTAEVTINCGNNFACQSLILDASNISIAASIDCKGDYTCRYLEVYMNKMKDLHLNCSDNYACQLTKLYSSKPIAFNTLDCDASISTSCRSLTAYCAYPLLNEVCTMEHQSVDQFWYCSGDLCLYDDYCENYDGLKLYPNRGSILGGDTILITGPCFNPMVNYTCKFGIEETNLHIINGTHGYCILPASSERGNVLFWIFLDNQWFGMIGRFYYNDLNRDYNIGIRNLHFLIDDENDTNLTNITGLLQMQPFINFDFFVDDSDINMTWDVSANNHKIIPENVDINLYQIIPYPSNNGLFYLEAKFLSCLSANLPNDGIDNIYLNYSNVSTLNISNDWNIFYQNASELSHTFVIMAESTTIVDSIPVNYRIVSKFVQHIVLNDTNSSFTRRRLKKSKSTKVAKLMKNIKKIWKSREKLGLHCEVWKFIDNKIFGDWWNKRRLPNCPDTDPQTFINRGRCEGTWEIDPRCNRFNPQGCEEHQAGADSCIRSAQGQHCCYTNNKLCTTGTCAGSPQLAPLFGVSRWNAINDIITGNFVGAANQGWKYIQYYFADELPKQWCKAADWELPLPDLIPDFLATEIRNAIPFNLGNDVIPWTGIEDYHDRRPPNKGGAGSAPEACGLTGGDPHLCTLDLYCYTLNCIGDYYYLYHENFKILVRMEQFNNGSIITQFGLDIDVNSTSTFNRSTSGIIASLEVSIDQDKKIFNVYMNGEIMLFSSDMYGINIVIGDVSIRYNEINVLIRCQFGVFIELWLRQVTDKLYFIEYTVDLDAQYQHVVSGLIGNYDDDDSNDLQSRNGTILPHNSTIKDIHYNFGLSWSLNATDNNIFHSPFQSAIHPLQFIPIFEFGLVDDAIYQNASEICGGIFSCIFDIIATEVDEIANTTLKFVQFVEETVETNKILYNITDLVTPSPTLSGCNALESMNLQILVDSNCNITGAECIEQQLFISQLLETIKSTNTEIEQLFGYIKYGNGLKELFSLHDQLNNNFINIIKAVREITNCNDLSGILNNPYFALQIAIQRFEEINNDKNNIILIISGCKPNLEMEHICSMKNEFQGRNIQVFVINHNNNGNYECLVNDIQSDISNITRFNLDDIQNVINGICLSSSVTNYTIETGMPTTNNPTIYPTKNPTVVPSINPITISTNNPTIISTNNPSIFTTTL
eukprot:390188_1